MVTIIDIQVIVGDFTPTALINQKNGEKRIILIVKCQNISLVLQQQKKFEDYVSITIKDRNFKEKYQSRITDEIKNFTNGRTDINFDLINFSKIPQDQDNWGWKLFYKLNKLLAKIKN